MSKNDDDFEKVHWWPFWLILLFVVSSWFIFVMEWFPWWTEENARGTFGDSFGVVNALFSGLAFAGVICAILLQKKELELQRAEIREQKETLQKQNFESSFFQLLGLHNDIVNSMEIQDKACSRRECFGYMHDTLLRLIYREVYPKVAQSSEDDSLEIERFNTQYEEFFRLYQSFLSPYFLHLYQVINFVDEHEFFDKDEKEYKKEKKRNATRISSSLNSQAMN